MADEAEVPKAARVALILKRLETAPPVASREDALALMARFFEEVETEHQIPVERRILPPIAAMEAQVKDRPRIRRYRHTNHYTLIGDNGAIVVRVFTRHQIEGIYRIVGERTELDKPGADGRTVDELGF